MAGEQRGQRPVKALKVGKAAERVKVFTAAEITRILKACDRYPERNSYGHDNPARVRAFVLTLRYSGLRIGDVVGLRRDICTRIVCCCTRPRRASRCMCRCRKRR